MTTAPGTNESVTAVARHTSPVCGKGSRAARSVEIKITGCQSLLPMSSTSTLGRRHPRPTRTPHLPTRPARRIDARKAPAIGSNRSPRLVIQPPRRSGWRSLQPARGPRPAFRPACGDASRPNPGMAGRGASIEMVSASGGRHPAGARVGAHPFGIAPNHRGSTFLEASAAGGVRSRSPFPAPGPGSGGTGETT